MRKPSGNTGKRTVLSVTPLELTVQIRFTDGTSLYLTKGDYVSGETYFYPGKEISEEEIRKFSLPKEDVRPYSYLVKLLTSGRLYSKKELLQKLMNVQKMESEDALRLIDKAENEGLYDEENYIRLYEGEMKEKKVTFRKIKDNLLKEGADINLVEKVMKESPEPDEDELQEENFKEVLSSLKGRNYDSVVRNAVSKLVKKGYSPSVRSALERYIASHPETEEKIEALTQRSLEQEIISLRYSLGRTVPDPKERDEKIKKRLLARGYLKGDIIKAMEKTR